MKQQNRVAVQHDYTFLQTSAEVRRFVASGYLVRLPGNRDYQLASVSHPYARPQVRTFVERLAAQYRAACGEKLVLTSLTRPVREQPRNASDLSVHPAGMAVDVRISRKSSCRRWLEKTLLALERQRVLDVTREKRPPHYHVALFPNAYDRYLASVTRSAPASSRVAASVSRQPREPVRVTTSNPPRATPPLGATPSAAPNRSGDAPPSAAATTVRTAAADAAAADAAPDGAADANVADTRAVSAQLTSSGTAAERDATLQKYRVARGETMWSIARRHGTTVEMIMALNGLDSPTLTAGQLITVPVPPAAHTSETTR